MAKLHKEQTTSAEKGKEIQAARPVQLLSPFEEMDRMFENLFEHGGLRPLRWEWPARSRMGAPFEGHMPKVDVIERDDEILVRAEVPGVNKKDLDISVTEHSVTIKGETSRESKQEEGDYYRSEISRGAFARTVSLPGDVNVDKARARFEDGVLELTLPKVEKAKRRSITIG